jgi:hypothetical protein
MEWLKVKAPSLSSNTTPSPKKVKTNKQTNKQEGWDHGSVVEYLPSMHKALDSIPKKTQKKNKQTMHT